MGMGCYTLSMTEETPHIPEDTLGSDTDAQPSGGFDAGLTGGLAAAFPRKPVVTNVVPERLGPYRIHGILGEGGMGRVYDASEEFPERRVALKVLRNGLETEGLLRRFEREAELLARLHHRGIAQIFAAGNLEYDGRQIPFLAMERVDGLPLDKWLRAADPSRNERIELVAKIADAVHHAHLKGVIHRDLKPGNILVDGEGQPKVVDFGIARVLERDAAQSLQTKTGQILGTLAYMAPEQVIGDPDGIDARADVYSLGVLLYEVLSGALPLDIAGRNIGTAINAILEQSPVLLGKQSAALKGDLETIAERALEKEPERRYDSAAALADDLRRFLRFEPIQARPTTAFYQMSRFARRHRVSVGLAFAFFLALTGGLASTLVYARQADERKLQAEQERDTKTKINAILAANLALASPFHRGARNRGSENLKEIERQIGVGMKNDPDVEIPLRIALARGYRQIGLLDGAQRNLQLAVYLVSIRRTPQPKEDLAIELELCRLLIERDQPQEAQPRLEIAYVQAQAIYGPDGREVCQIRADLITCKVFKERSDAALQEALELLTKTERLFGKRDPDSLSALKLLVMAASFAGRSSEAIRLSKQHVELCKEVYGPLHGRTLAAQIGQASFLSWAGQVHEADELLKLIEYDAVRTFGQDNWVRRSLIQTIGENHSNAGRYEEAAKALDEAARLNGATLGEAHSSTLMCRDQRAIALRRAGLHEDALAEFHAVRNLREESLGSDHADLGGSWTAIAITLRIMGRFDEALECFEKAQANGLVNFERGHDLNLWTETSLARLLLRMGRNERAVCILEEVVPLRKGLAGTENTTYCSDLKWLGDALRAAGNYPRAQVIYGRCLAYRPPSWKEADWDWRLLFKISLCQKEQGQAGEEWLTLQDLQARMQAHEDVDPEFGEAIAARLNELAALDSSD